MNFDTFRDSLSTFARTSEKLRAFVSASPIQNEPTWQSMRLPKQDRYSLAQLMQTFGLIHALCEQKKGVDLNQASWNACFLETLSLIGEALCASIKIFHETPERLRKASESLGKIKKKLKNVNQLSLRQQRRRNETTIDVLRRLVDTHKCIGQSKMQLVGCKADLLSKLSARLDVASKLNSRASRGVRRLMGSFGLEQKSINHEFFKILEGLCSIHLKVRKFIQKKEVQRFHQSADEIMNMIHVLHRQLQEGELRLASIEHNQLFLSSYLPSLHQGNRQARQ
jgi:cob(I)alamin adenosyltransferase